jgi:uncharacterized membrane protein
MDTSHDTGNKITPKPTFRPLLDLLIGVIMAIQVIVAISGFAILPDTVPIHWGIQGEANGYGPKWVGTLLFPLMSIGIYVLVRLLLAAGPRLGGRENSAANLRLVRIILTGITLFLLIVQLSALAQTLGMGFDMTMVVMLALSVLFIFLGNYMGKIRRNFWMGIRTPWSLANAVVWERTHRLGGWLFVAVGLIGLPCSFVPNLRLWGIIVPMIAVSIILYLYSYMCYQQQEHQGDEPLSPPFDGDNV